MFDPVTDEVRRLRTFRREKDSGKSILESVIEIVSSTAESILKRE